MNYFLDVQELEALLPFCTTEKQKQNIEMVIKHRGIREAARKIGVDHSALSRMIDRVRKTASIRGVAPNNDLNYPLPEGQIIIGTSTLQRSPSGNLQWVKTKTSAQEQLDMMREAIEAMVEDIPRLPERQLGDVLFSDLLAVYPLGDLHIGMMAWGEESGQDWDLKIAENKILSTFQRLVMTAPHCKQALIVNLGDFFHSDNLQNVTSRSGNRLDVDGRYAKMVRIGMRIIRTMIDAALCHHESVHIINSIGNHDDCGSMFMSIALQNVYENEPRVTIDASPAPFHYFKYGNVLIGAHHGHTCKSDRLPGVMASDRAKDWGATEFRYWLTGHIHHDSKKEYPGVTVESFRTMAAKDAYSACGGYRSGQDSKCLVMHKQFGEIERHTVCIQQVS
jgi:hypothetical protein